MLEDIGKTLSRVGQIKPHRLGVQYLLLANWRAFYENDFRFEHAPPRVGRNPTTGDPVIFTQPVDQRAVRRSGRWIAWYSWETAAGDSRGRGFLDVHVASDVEDEMLKLALEVADSLDARLFQDLNDP